MGIKVTEIQNARIVDVERGELYPAGTPFMVEGDRLVIGEACNRIHGDNLVDYTGKYICPALFNVHTHVLLAMPTVFMSITSLRATRQHLDEQVEYDMENYLKNGVTHVRDALTEDIPAFNRLRDKMNGGRQKGPRLYKSLHIAPMGGTFAPEQSWLYRTMMQTFGQKVLKYGDPENGVLVVPTDASAKVLKDAVKQAVSMSTDYIKVYSDKKKKVTFKDGATYFTEGQLAVIVEEANLHNIKVHMHHLDGEDFERGIRAGVQSLAHIPIDQLLNERHLALLESSRTMIEPTLSLSYTYSANYGNHEMKRWIDFYQRETRENKSEKYWVNKLQPFNKAFYARVENRQLKAMGIMNLQHIFDRFAPYLDFGMKNVKRLIEAGLSDRIALGNDGGAMTLPGCAIDVELDLMKRCYEELEIPASRVNREVLAIATINSAKSMGIDDKFGSLVTGKIADFIVLDENPLENIDILKSSAKHVYRAGQRLI